MKSFQESVEIWAQKMRQYLIGMTLGLSGATASKTRSGSVLDITAWTQKHLVHRLVWGSINASSMDSLHICWAVWMHCSKPGIICVYICDSNTLVLLFLWKGCTSCLWNIKFLLHNLTFDQSLYRKAFLPSAQRRWQDGPHCGAERQRICSQHSENPPHARSDVRSVVGAHSADLRRNATPGTDAK